MSRTLEEFYTVRVQVCDMKDLDVSCLVSALVGLSWGSGATVLLVRLQQLQEIHYPVLPHFKCMQCLPVMRQWEIDFAKADGKFSQCW